MSNTDFSFPLVMSEQGPIPTPPATILAQLIANISATNPGYTANLPGSLIEDLSSTEVAGIILCDTARIETINSLTPFGANAFLLSQLGQIYIGPGSAPAVPTNTSVFVIFTVTDTATGALLPGYVLPVGFTVSDGTYQYFLQDGGVTASDGQSQPLFCQASTPGTWAVPTNTVTLIATQPPQGITIVCTNPSIGTSGAEAETEEAYRARVLQAGQATAQGTPQFLKTILEQVPNVQTRLVSVRQQPGEFGGWEVLCGGGDPYEIAYAIFTAIPDVSTLTGSILAVTNITMAANAQVTTDINHGFATGQIAKIGGLNGMWQINDVPFTVTVVDEKNFTVGIDTRGYTPYISGGVVTPNLRNQTPSIVNSPDVYTIPFVVPPGQTVEITVTWQTTDFDFTSVASVAALASPAISDYVNAIIVGQPMSLIELGALFATSVSSLLDVSQISSLSFAVNINGVATAPVGQLFFGDPESYFTTTPASIIVEQG